MQKVNGNNRIVIDKEVLEDIVEDIGNILEDIETIVERDSMKIIDKRLDRPLDPKERATCIGPLKQQPGSNSGRPISGSSG